MQPPVLFAMVSRGLGVVAVLLAAALAVFLVVRAFRRW